MARLDETHDDGGRRYSLAGQPLSCGDLLEVQLRDGWLPVRFEMDAQGYAVFYLPLSEGRGLESQVELRLPDFADLRWPQEDVHANIQVAKLRGLVEALTDLVQRPDDASDEERAQAAAEARALLRETAPRVLEAL
ncbi:DUF5348 domain-containing protein [Deinococcus multiflagellatus]|uniref:DUF5348 domain-containing protein n=1 Tax=Deinococcus multiflagellatus TaxID=1656887 RepID=A0ABW1ZPY2_9DEIO|nr:DUF5348 domain-containing protein [Deinococcus multiflagellatus]MBZ9715934.1 DUF5348 domain-containing protein [Deinococcus multiflagellatus]